jgi:hypothetical protein
MQVGADLYELCKNQLRFAKICLILKRFMPCETFIH